MWNHHPPQNINNNDDDDDDPTHTHTLTHVRFHGPSQLQRVSE